MKHIADIIERGIREHPELSVGMQTEGIEVKFSLKIHKVKHLMVLLFLLQYKKLMVLQNYNI